MIAGCVLPTGVHGQICLRPRLTRSGIFPGRLRVAPTWHTLIQNNTRLFLWHTGSMT